MQMLRRNLLSWALGFMLTAVPAIGQQVIATVTVGAGPVGEGVDRATNQIYVVNNTDGTVMDIDGATNQVIHTVTVGSSPVGGDLNSATGRGYVANSGDNTVSVIDLATTTIVATVPVQTTPGTTKVNPVTNKIYVANSGTNTVSVIDGATNQVINTITVGTQPRGTAVNQLTNRIYVSNRSDNTVSVIDGSTDSVIATLTGMSHPGGIAVNLVTNKIYVNNQASNYVTVIDGATNNTSTITVGNRPFSAEADFVTNMIYVVNQNDNTVSVIDGATNSVIHTVPVGLTPNGLGVDVPTNRIYVSNATDNTVTMIDGATFATRTLSVGTFPEGVAVNPVTNRIYVANTNSNTVSVIAGANSSPAQFVAITPCRLIDTRQTGGPIPGGTSRVFNLPQLAQSASPPCASLASATVFSLNVTVVPSGQLSYLTVWPTGEEQPQVSTLNSLDGRIKADAAIVPAGYQGDISVYVTNTTNVVLDINGYFAPPSGSTLAFYPLSPPCRVADTRSSNYPPGLGTPHLSGLVARDFPILSSPCIPTGVSPDAYSFNMTVVPYPSGSGSPLGYLELWPKDQMPPHPVSTLNNLTGTVVANAAIVPAGTGGEITALAQNNTDLIIDINGYFAPAGPGGLSLYPAAPCRVIDTRHVGNGQPFSGTLSPPVDVVDSQCGPPSTAQAYVFNATVVPVGALGYLTLWPDPLARPTVSTLNALDGWITNNMAIVPNSDGKTDAYASGITQVILDISSYFAP